MIVTDIKKGKNGNSLLFCDGRYLMAIKTEVILKNKIEVGFFIDDKIFNKIKDESDLCKAKEKAFNLLTYRNRSKKELRERLLRVTSETATELAIKKMETLGLVDDFTFASQYAKELFNKRFSVLKVKYKLKEKGICSNIIEEVIADINVNEEKQILILLRSKFWGKFNDEKGKNRVINILNRMGYEFSVIKRAFSLYTEGIQEDELI